MNRRNFLHLISLSAIGAATGCKGHSAAASFSALSSEASTAGEFIPDVELNLTAAPDEISVLPGALTRVWRFTGKVAKGPADTLTSLPGSYLGPVIRLRRGQKVRIRFLNQLPEDSIVHWHGLDSPEAADGHPRLAIGTGKEYVYEFEVTNRAGTYWYHPHPHMRTGAQVYHGLAGLLLVQDTEEDALKLPSGDNEHLCVLQDRTFDEQNQLVYRNGGMNGMMSNVTGFLGDRMMVNGRPVPTTEVDAAWHRVRLINCSNARIYKLAWSRDIPVAVIGGDGGLLEKPLLQQVITLAPGQRADVLLDLTGLEAGTDLHLQSMGFPETDANVGRMGMMDTTSKVPNGAKLRLMTLHIGDRKGEAFHLPSRLSTFDSTWSLIPDAEIRTVPISFQRMRWLLDGRTFVMDGVAPEETVQAGSIHVWEFVNQTNRMGMEAAHPIHIHGPQFRVVTRIGGSTANSLREGIIDSGWKDTVLVLPGETVRVQVPFTRHPGIYLYHCHILEHEDMGMMRNFRVM